MGQNVQMVIIAGVILLSLSMMSSLFKRQTYKKAKEDLDTYFNHLPKNITANFIRIERQHSFYNAIYEYEKNGLRYKIVVDLAVAMNNQESAQKQKQFTFPESVIYIESVAKSDGTQVFFESWALFDEAKRNKLWS